MQRRPLLALLVIAGFAAFAGCSKSNHMAPQEAGFGKVNVALTDAPADVDHIYLDVREVWVHRLDDGTPGDGLTMADAPGYVPDSTDDGDGDGEHEDDDSGVWHRLDADPQIIDLLELRNGVFEELATGTVPAGTYDQMRLKLGPDNTIVVDGTEESLKVPSGQSSGYKLMGTFHVPIDGVVDIGLDFDADRSVHVTGAGQWMLHPVVRIHEIVTTGRIHGRIDPGSAISKVYALQEPDTIATTESESDGQFVLALLPAGDYLVRISPTVEGFRDTVIGPVHVAVGETTELGTIALGEVLPVTGSVSGTVVPGDVSTWVVLLDSGNAAIDSVVTTPSTGAFSFAQVAAGSYGLVLKPPATYETRFFGPFVVTAGANNDLGPISLTPVLVTAAPRARTQ